MTEGYTVSSLEELIGFREEGAPSWHMIRTGLGIGSFGINAWTATQDGQALIGEHDEVSGSAGGHEELYLVIAGHATFTVAGETVDAPTGTVVWVADPTLKRGAAGTNGTTILVVGGKPGEAFTPSLWERNAEALRFWTTQEWDKAIAVFERMLVETPGNANALYNLACAEARAGKTEEALGHLAEAVALQPDLREGARGDDDFASIRDDPRFLARPDE